MRLALITIGSWLAGLGTLLFGFNLARLGGPSQLSGAAFTSLVGTTLLFALAYPPALTWLKNRLGDTERRGVFTLTSSLIVNVPVFLVSLLAIGRTLLATEAYAVMISFTVMGALFGRGFVWNSQKQKRIKEARHPLSLIMSKQALTPTN